MSYHDGSVFATLTYDDDHLPPDESLDKSVLQRFFKRLRKDLGDRRIKYFACGEYGETYGRPHYHAIIFGLSLTRAEDKELVQENWPYGFIKLGTVTYDSARYVADYIQKKYDGPMVELYRGRTPPFQLASLGIGKRFCDDNASQLRDRLGITVRGTPVGIPRYYKKKLEIPSEELFEKGAEQRQRLLEHYEKLSDEEVLPAIQKARKQHDKNIESRLSLRKKGKF